MEHIGTGLLSWEVRERWGGRFGYLILLESASTRKRIRLTATHLVGLHGQLYATVLETRTTRHSHLHHLQACLPISIGSTVLLGEGVLAKRGTAVGLIPEDLSFPWLNETAIKRLHDQTVKLMFVKT